jgi:hypothetical protein
MLGSGWSCLHHVPPWLLPLSEQDWIFVNNLQPVVHRYRHLVLQFNTRRTTVKRIFTKLSKNFSTATLTGNGTSLPFLFRTRTNLFCSGSNKGGQRKECLSAGIIMLLLLSLLLLSQATPGYMTWIRFYLTLLELWVSPSNSRLEDLVFLKV